MSNPMHPKGAYPSRKCETISKWIELHLFLLPLATF